VSALGREIRQRIALEGPITVERYMALCLAHPTLGYYMTRDPLGLDGDFITAPEISQMFGELIGLWAAQVWLDMGSPQRVRLIELGPGRGTLMADALRATRIVPGFHEAITIDLVETSPILAKKQQAALANSPAAVACHSELSAIGDGPAIVIANEFFDALPVRQFVRAQGGWRERLVGLAENGELAFGLAPEPTREIAVAGREGAVLEWPVAGLSIMRALAERLVAQGGAALVIDYGHLRSGLADTLQAVKNHAFTDALSEPGEADITAHVDFAQLASAAQSVGGRIHGPTSQGAFLRALGIEARAATLARGAPARAEEFEAAKLRLTGSGEDDMGALFKVLGISAPALAALPGL
jgi:SAM-dependent MidA family methyltransferase